MEAPGIEPQQADAAGQHQAADGTLPSADAPAEAPDSDPKSANAGGIGRLKDESEAAALDTFGVTETALARALRLAAELEARRVGVPRTRGLARESR